MTTDKSPKVHHGRNIKRNRAWHGMKQESLADALGEEWNQKKISALEAQEQIDDELLEKIAKILNVEMEALKDDFSDDRTVYQYTEKGINNSIDNTHGTIVQNAIDDYREAMKKIQDLYDLVIKEKDDKIQLLERMLKMQEEMRKEAK